MKQHNSNGNKQCKSAFGMASCSALILFNYFIESTVLFMLLYVCHSFMLFLLMCRLKSLLKLRKISHHLISR